MKSRKQVMEFVKDQWPLELSGTLLLVSVLSVLTYSLTGLVEGSTTNELATLSKTSGLPSLRADFVYYPYYFAVYVLRQIISDGLLAARMVSVIGALIAAISFWAIVKRWFNPRIAVVGTAIFIFNSYFITLARSGSPDILPIAALLSVYASSLWLLNNPKRKLSSIVLGVSLAISLFIPLLPVMMAIGLMIAVIVNKSLIKSLPKWTSYALIGGAGATLISAAISLWLSTDAFRAIYGFPATFINPLDLFANFRDVLATIFWEAPSRPTRWLGDIPLFDIFGVVMVVLGIYHHEQFFGSRRSLLIFSSSAALMLFLSANNGIDTPGFSLAYPLITLFIVSGLYELLELWKRVFPLNPIAKIISAGSLALLVGMSSYYQLNRYFIAWPSSPTTREAYSVNINDNTEVPVKENLDE